MNEKQLNAELGAEGTEVNEPLEEPRRYIMPPHPVVTDPIRTETIIPEEPIAAKDSLPDLVQQAVENMHIELSEEIDKKTSSLQADLQAELQSELQNNSEIKKQ